MNVSVLLHKNTPKRSGLFGFQIGIDYVFNQFCDVMGVDKLQRLLLMLALIYFS